MANEEQDVLMRLERLEGRVGLADKSTFKAAELTATEIETYHRVETLLWEDGSCGINETSPCIFKCAVLKAERLVPIFPRECDVECSCGPCNVLDSVARGLRRFTRLGG